MLTLQQNIIASVPTSLDGFLCNYYNVGSNMKIETIAEYLARVPIAMRRANVEIQVILESGLIPLDQFAQFQSVCTYRKYMFIDGVENANFLEYVATPNFKGLVEYAEFGFADVVADTVQIFDLDMDVTYPATITELSIRTDVGTLRGTVKKNGVAIEGLINILVGSVRTRFPVQTDTVRGDIITLETTGAGVNNPTYLGGKLVKERL